MDIKKSKRLKGKRILITAGPTWVPVDSVRVISNSASGSTGIMLAEKLNCLGAKVTLLLGPVSACCLSSGIKIINFRFFDELKHLMARELGSKKYDLLIHSAAVSDYRPSKRVLGKINSGRKVWRLDLIPTPKLINCVKGLDRNIFLVGFKFEPQAGKTKLIRKARGLMRNARVDMAVANTCRDNGRYYRAFILSRAQIFGPYSGKNSLAEGLVRRIGELVCRN